MSGGGAALVVIPLRDGSELRVTPDGVRVGEHLYELGRIQDARQVAPNPVTIALRVAGSGMVEFQPVQPEQGALALEAIYRLRTELRPPGFEPVSATPPGFPPVPRPGAPYPPAAPGYAPYAPYAPPGYPYTGGYPSYGPPPYAPAARGPSPNATRGELTPYPRGVGETLSAIFQLYGKHFGAWIKLALCVVLPQVLLIGILNVAQDELGGTNPFVAATGGTGATSSALLGANNCTLTLPSFSASDLATFGAFTGASLVLSFLFGAWQTGAFAHAGREAVLGRRVPVGASVRRGAGRFVPVLFTSLLALLCEVVWLAPGVVCLGLAIADLNGANICDSQTIVATHPTAAALDAAGFLLLVAGGLTTAFFAVRLAVAPYIAATEPAGPFRALSRGWRLTRGSWWRVFVVLIVLAVTTGVIGLAVVTVAGVLPALELLVANPLIQVLLSPLLELAYVVLLFDLRLRREGYASVTREAETPVAAAQPASPPMG